MSSAFDEEQGAAYDDEEKAEACSETNSETDAWGVGDACDEVV